VVETAVVVALMEEKAGLQTTVEALPGITARVESLRVSEWAYSWFNIYP